jgi:hypothetical protein
MVTRKFSKMLLIVLMAATVAGAAAAQDGGAGGAGNGGRGPGGRGPGGMGGRGPGALVEIVKDVTEATDLTAREVTEAIMSGQTVAEILTANGADPEAFVQESLTQARERLTQQVTDGKLTQEEADTRLAQREADLRAFVFEGTLPEGGMEDRLGQGRPIVQLAQILVEQAGLELPNVMQSLRDGKTLTTLIEEAGKEVAIVKQATIDAATIAINEAVTAGTLTQERADQMIANLSTVIDRLLTGDLKPGMEEDRGPRARGRLAAVVAEATGLTVEEVRAEVDAGKTLADVLASKNITVETFVEDQLQPMKDHLAEGVTNGRITQAIADARLELARVELTERLNGNLPMDEAGPMDAAPMTTPEATTESQS